MEPGPVQALPRKSHRIFFFLYFCLSICFFFLTLLAIKTPSVCVIMAWGEEYVECWLL